MLQPCFDHIYSDFLNTQEDKRLLYLLQDAIAKIEEADDSREVNYAALKVNWGSIASQMGKEAQNRRSAKQCRDRWHNYLRPGIKKGKWTKEEEEQILELYTSLGGK